MSNLDEKVEKLEEAVDPNTVISVGGYNFTPAKLMIAGTILTTVLGGLYGAFEVYKDYMDMKEAIQTYVAPDLSELNKRIAIAEQNADKAVDYTRDINNNLKTDIRRLEGIHDSVERGTKQSQRDVDNTVKEIKREVDNTTKELKRDVNTTTKEINQEMNRVSKDMSNELKNLRKEVDDKIKKAIDNPLANN
jgi:DNA anti-recombination protein RmuC